MMAVKLSRIATPPKIEEMEVSYGPHLNRQVADLSINKTNIY